MNWNIERMQRGQRGITLIELIIVMVVVAILASIAIPSYRSYLLRAQRSDAKAALLQVQTAEEKFLLQQNRYTTDVTSKPADGGLGLLNTSEHGYYSITVPALTNIDGSVGYTVQADPVAGGGQSDDTPCTQFQLDSAGQHAATDSGGADNRTVCWK